MGFSTEFYRGRKVFITGHTGFKGSWMCRVLLLCGAKVTGYSLPDEEDKQLFELSGVKDAVCSVYGDIRDREALAGAMREAEPEIVIHMAAQPLVRASYEDPAGTYETNVMGTVNVLEALRQVPSVRSFINVTTDKVYKNREWEWGYRENEELNGYDPYSNSKSCSELVTDTYVKCFLQERGIAVSTCRAGNVIGGGDFAADRIIPDCVRAASNGMPIELRNPSSVRPYQHVLEPVIAYLMIAQEQYLRPELAGSYNIGPADSDCVTTRALAECFAAAWTEVTGCAPALAMKKESGAPHEANLLRLDCAKVRRVFGWKPVWHMEDAVKCIVEWTDCHRRGGDIPACMDDQIRSYLRGAEAMA